MADALDPGIRMTCFPRLRSPCSLFDSVRSLPPTLLAVVWLSLSLGGCASTGPAPVSGWDWTGPAPAGYYLVRRGDSLSLVAERLRIDARKLAQWNGLKPPYPLYAETLLRIEPPDGSRPRRVARAAGATTPKSEPKRAESTGATRRRAVKAAPSVRQTTAAEPVVSRSDDSGVTWDWPVSGPLVQTFRADDRTRQGIRLGGRAGEQVRACADGQVVYSGDGLKSYGNLIIVKHNEKYLSAYGFNRRLLVTEGDRVKRGQPVAEIGQGPEGAYLLHFEVRHEGTAVDPLRYLPPRN